MQTLQHALEAYKIAPEIARHGAGISTFADMWGYKIEAYDAIPYNVAVTMRAGVLSTINSDDDGRARRLNIDAAKLVRYGGLTDDEALATITINDILQVIGIFFVVVKLILGFFGSIGLVVAIFGIANTMVMAVIERTREIGVLKALGARNRDVRRLFLAEACTIGFGGGLMGVGGGWLIGAVLNAAAAFFFKEQLGGESYAFFQLSSWLILGAIGIATFVAAVAGIYPAARAARLDPVESLRVE